jgi:hypothetical protein
MSVVQGPGLGVRAASARRAPKLGSTQAADVVLAAPSRDHSAGSDLSKGRLAVLLGLSELSAFRTGLVQSKGSIPTMKATASAAIGPIPLGTETIDQINS